MEGLVRRKLLRSYSQYYEDLFIEALVGKPNPFYIDVGANDPSRLNNADRFYDQGGRGINIEPDPSLYAKLRRARPRDVNLNVGISSVAGALPFYRMSADTLSTFDLEVATQAARHGYRVVETISVPVERLDEVIARHRPNGVIDFLSIDVEGHEIEILCSNDWTRYRPKVLVVEINRQGEELKRFLAERRYRPVIDNGTNCIFIDQDDRSDT